MRSRETSYEEEHDTFYNPLFLIATDCYNIAYRRDNMPWIEITMVQQTHNFECEIQEVKNDKEKQRDIQFDPARDC